MMMEDTRKYFTVFSSSFVPYSSGSLLPIVHHDLKREVLAAARCEEAYVQPGLYACGCGAGGEVFVVRDGLKIDAFVSGRGGGMRFERGVVYDFADVNFDDWQNFVFCPPRDPMWHMYSWRQRHKLLVAAEHLPSPVPTDSRGQFEIEVY